MADGLAARLYNQYGGEDKLTPRVKEGLQRQAARMFVEAFLPIKERCGPFKLFTRKVPQILSEDEIARKLVELGLANNFEDAKRTIPKVVTKEYSDGIKHIASCEEHYEFVPRRRNEKGDVLYELTHFYDGGDPC